MITLASIEDSNYFTMEVKNYEQLDETGSNWDDNWLIVSGSAQTQDFAAWTYEDACLSTWDLVEIADWFEKAAKGQVRPRKVTSKARRATSEWMTEKGWLAFVEPCLAFLLVDVRPEALRLAIRMSEEVSPPTAEESEFVILTLSPVQLIEAASGLRRDAERFPRRGG